jgi:integrase
MPRQQKPPRLYLKSEQRDDHGRVTHGPIWIIIHGGRQFGTRCGVDDYEGAKRALEAYIGRKYTEAATAGPRPIDKIPVVDVLALYARDKMPKHARPEECRRRLKRLGDYFKRFKLADINGPLCREYAKTFNTDTMARRHLEELRAAINHHRREGLHNQIVSVVMPERRPPRERWLTVQEVAQLIRAAWRFREVQQGKETAKRPRQHIARFILIALYTGTRATTIMQASFEKEPGRPCIDLEAGTYHRRPEGAVETKKRRPTIYLPDELLAHMRRWRRHGARYAVEHHGQPVKRIGKTFQKLVKECGLEGIVTPHTLRHTAATWLMQNGTDIYQASRYLGMSIRTLETTYAHHHPGYLEQARTAFRRRRTNRENPVSLSTFHQRKA